MSLAVPPEELDTYCFMTRYSDEELATKVKGFEERAEIPAEWYKKLSVAFAENPRPSLRAIKSLHSEGEKLPYPMICLGPLKIRVDKASRFVEDVQMVLSRKALNRRQAGSKTENGHDSSSEGVAKQPSQMQQLLDESMSLPFSCVEITQIRERGQEILHFSKTVESLMRSPMKPVNEYEEMLNLGRSFNLALPEVEVLEKIVGRMRWSEKVASIGSRASLDLDEVVRLISDGERAGITQDDPLLQTLQIQKALSDQVEERAQKVLQSDFVRIDDLARLAEECKSHPVSRATSKLIRDALERHTILTKQIESLSQDAEKTTIGERPLYKDVKKVVEDSRILASKPNTFALERDLRLVEEWMRKGKRIFGKGNAPLYILKSHLTFISRRNEACLSFDDTLENDLRYEANVLAGRPNPEDSGKVFCFCRLPESGLMIECDICHEW
jgi:histone demethylase JARID1